MGSLIKKTVSEVVFMDSMSSANGARYLTLKIDNEYAGRFFVLSGGTAGDEIYLHSPEDFKKLYEAALELWAQGDMFYPGDSEEPKRGEDIEK